MTVKIFVGNLAFGTEPSQLREIFEQHGTVAECDVLGGYGFIHMDSEDDASKAVKALSGYNLNGSRINVELSTATTQGRAKIASRSTWAVKIFVGNLSKSTTNEMLRELFETYGTVGEADVISGFGFVHMSHEQEAFKAIKALNGYVLDGTRINVELSTGGTQGKSRERDSHSASRGGMPAPPRSRLSSARYDPYPVPPAASLSRRVDPYESYGYPSSSSSSRASSDSFARDLLELYIKNPVAFDAYAKDPLVRKALSLPPVEADDSYYRASAAVPSTSRDYYERRRLAELSSAPASLGADPYASPSDYAPYNSMPASSRAWPGSGASSYGVAGGSVASGDAGPPLASAKGKGHLYTSFE